ncbi:zinc finger protein-domain-containing protein [Lasiosphaeris hirsuta]|uniref:Zinc finger protein-domain-containing protein n=1 Tax=Lasiosphaeris hirsuta TaxID=260670 RepID=A0AA39ZVT9_9PEZI|nr:zinc finger protein-domain-containing protein [Lasiosphaeris hirsuta]
MYITEFSTACSKTQLQRIGQGFCGSVWANTFSNIDFQSSALVLKREDGGPGRSLLKEYRNHHQILAALQAGKTVAALYRVNIPESFLFMDETSPHWASILARLPPRYTACNASVSERIMPMPQNIVKDSTNEHCLIRPYLGRTRGGQQSPSDTRPRRPRVFSLRNFPLHLDQITEFGLPAHEYAIAMADALSFLHWSAEVDANDVEFVLGRCRTQTQSETVSQPRPGIGSRGFPPGVLGPHAMWILDFDCCGQLTINEAGVEQAAKCFWRNDPFYPKPGSGSPQGDDLWEVFRARFLRVSEEMLQGEDKALQQLPGMLMDRIVETRGVWAKNPT